MHGEIGIASAKQGQEQNEWFSMVQPTKRSWGRYGLEIEDLVLYVHFRLQCIGSVYFHILKKLGIWLMS